jgi:hypothetical protein
MNKISRTLQVGRTDVVEFRAKMLLCLQHVETDGL